MEEDEGTIGKGLYGALKLLKDRGILKETVEWGGRNMDKKKNKLVGIVDTDVDAGSSKERFKDINLERTDEFGRVLTPKEAFRLLSHNEELKLKQMKNSDTPSLSVERMIGAQTQLKTPYLVLSGNVKPSDSTILSDAGGLKGRPQVRFNIHKGSKTEFQSPSVTLPPRPPVVIFWTTTLDKRRAV